MSQASLKNIAIESKLGQKILSRFCYKTEKKMFKMMTNSKNQAPKIS